MSKTSRTKTRISITILPTINNMLDMISKKKGTSKSMIIENALNQYLNEQLEADAKSLANMTFDDLPTENEWAEIQSIIQ